MEAILIGSAVVVLVIILITIIVSAVKDVKRNKLAKQNTQVIVDNKEEIKQEVKEDVIEDLKQELKEEIKEEIKQEQEEKPMKLVLAQGESVQFGSNGKLPCGEYIVESNDGSEKFNLRVGRYVKEFTNGDKLVLTENHKVTAVSTTVIFR